VAALPLKAFIASATTTNKDVTAVANPSGDSPIRGRRDGAGLGSAVD
jgi:hypothetical protein